MIKKMHDLTNINFSKFLESKNRVIPFITVFFRLFGLNDISLETIYQIF